jgi:DNA-binding XRE family transcriptional regulator
MTVEGFATREAALAAEREAIRAEKPRFNKVHNGWGRKLTYQGETITLQEWGARLGIPTSTIHRRLARGWSVERALTQQSRERFSMTDIRLLRAARGLIGMTQADLAKASGVSEIAIKNLERGATDPRASTIKPGSCSSMWATRGKVA